MAILDERGRLFGVVNVVDAMVVLVVLAGVLAGVAVLTAGDDGSNQDQPTVTRYATLTYEVPIESDAAALAEGEHLAPTDGQRYEVTDVYRSFASNATVHVTARVTYTDAFRVGGERVFGGDQLEVNTDSHRMPATVVSVNGSEAEIATSTTPVVIQSNLPEWLAAEIEPGTVATIAGDEVATVTAIEERDTVGGGVLVGVELVTVDLRPAPRYDGNLVRIGSSATIVTDTVVIPGEIVAVGTDDPADVDTSGDIG